MTKINAYAALAVQAPLEPFAYDASDLAPHDIEIEVSHCGICHSDIHLVDNDWKISEYPLVPGHEIIGKVTAAGSAISHLAPGSRVGVGWQRSACLSCELCLGGYENLCPHLQATCVGHRGGLADRIRLDGRFAFPIPESLDSASTAPLLCGGVTVYAPMKRFGIDATKHVGVIGIGGLGHIALLMLRAFGCEITAFSSTADKRDEALAMGAHHFVASNDAGAIRKHADSLHLLISTVAVRLDWITFIQTLRPNGTLCLVGAPPGLLQIPPMALLPGQKSITASEIGGRSTITEMLSFAARHSIAPAVQVLPMTEVNEAFDRVRKNQARYRMVVSR